MKIKNILVTTRNKAYLYYLNMNFSNSYSKNIEEFRTWIKTICPDKLKFKLQGYLLDHLWFYLDVKHEIIEDIPFDWLREDMEKVKLAQRKINYKKIKRDVENKNSNDAFSTIDSVISNLSGDEKEEKRFKNIKIK